MIKNGNYKQGEYVEIGKYILDAFKEYYKDDCKMPAEKIDRIVEEKIENTEYFTFNDREYILEYYDRFITKYRKDILNKFYEKLGIKRTNKLDAIIWEKGTTLSECNINASTLGGCNFESGEFSNEVQKLIEEVRQDLLDNLVDASEINNKEDEYKQIKKLRTIFHDCIEEVENEHPCDVFQDIHQLVINEKQYIREFLEVINKDCGNVFDSDIEAMKKPDFSLSELEELSAHGLVFSYDLSMGGLTDAFSSDKSELLLDKKVDEGSKIDIICDRLLYLYSLGDKINFRYLDRDSIPTLKNTLENYTDKESVDKMNKQIRKEYNYQCSHCNLSVLGEQLLQMKYSDKCEFTKNWAEGHFLSEYVADKIRSQRDYYNRMINTNLKYLPDNPSMLALYEYTINSKSDGINSHIYEDGDMYKPFNLVFVFDGLAGSKENYLHTMVHELNHTMAWHRPYEISRDYMKVVSGISHHVNTHKGTNVTGDVDVADTSDLEEYINERQAKDITEILLRHLKEDNVKMSRDKLMDDYQGSYGSFYDFYDFLFRDFYALFESDLKLLNIDDNMQFSFDFLLPTNNCEKVYSEMKRWVNRKVNRSNYYTSGLVDNKNIIELSKLARVYREEIYPYQKNLSIKEMNLNNCKNIEKLPVDIQMKVYKLVQKKNKIMDKIRQDYAKKVKFESKQPQSTSDEFDCTSEDNQLIILDDLDNKIL